MKLIDQFINFVIRPPRADYNPDQYLWEKDFNIAGRAYKRLDLELSNARDYTLKCSHYVPSQFPENSSLPCVVYCHGNSGCRADANEAAVVLLPLNITVFTLDFSGSGLSGGDFVSLGWHEKEDLRIVVSHLRRNKQVSCIGLWGRSMGAVTCLLYGVEDPSIAGMVLDSAFSNLYDLMMELVDVYKIRLPKFTVKMAVQYMRHVIQKKAKFDIMDLNSLQVAPKTFVPALFGHSSEDRFIQPHHCDLIFKSYAGDKSRITFDGDHNSSRPQSYYDSVCKFFYKILQPPQVTPFCSSKLEKYYDLGDLKLGAAMDESLLYEIIAGLRNVSCSAASSSSAIPMISGTRSLDVCLSEAVSLATVAGSMTKEEINALVGFDSSDLEDKPNGVSEECCSYTSSNRESWGRCSSLGGSDEEPSAVAVSTINEQISLEPLTTSPGKTKLESPVLPKLDKKAKMKKNIPTVPRMRKRDKLEALKQRLRLFLLKRVNHS